LNSGEPDSTIPMRLPPSSTGLRLAAGASGTATSHRPPAASRGRSGRQSLAHGARPETASAPSPIAHRTADWPGSSRTAHGNESWDRVAELDVARVVALDQLVGNRDGICGWTRNSPCYSRKACDYLPQIAALPGSDTSAARPAVAYNTGSEPRDSAMHASGSGGRILLIKKPDRTSRYGLLLFLSRNSFLPSKQAGGESAYYCSLSGGHTSVQPLVHEFLLFLSI